MAATVEVVCQIQGEPIAQVPINAEVCLLRIRVHKVPGLRISEWLEPQWQERGGI
jgi:hypothetical protein